MLRTSRRLTCSISWQSTVLLMIVKNRMVPSFPSLPTLCEDRLAALYLMHPRIWLAILNAMAHC